jgi:NAD(P)-dependent dehydrogenase (short-subunit alcohol dehydrogenase family)
MPSERLRLVTGARGTVGGAVADAAAADGHRVVLTDVAAPAYGPDLGPPYIRADLADLVLAAAAAVTAGHEVVYVAQPDNLMGLPLAEMLTQVYGCAAWTGPPRQASASPRRGRCLAGARSDPGATSLADGPVGPGHATTSLFL